ncbi:PE family protein [Mycobacterium tuberculosis]|nr:PE family protein [Mycobacterium tuberculosis]
MQFLSVIPEQVESAAQDLAGIRSALSASYAAAAGPTTAVVSAAEDEVSTAIASIFGAYGRQCQVLSAQASAFHDEFVNLLKTGATAYRNTEFANAQSNVLNAVNAPARSLLGHPSAAESVQNSAPTLGGGHSTVTAGLAAQAGRAVATVEQQAAAAVAPLPSAGAGLAQVVNGVVTAGQGSAAKLATALQSAAPWLAKSGALQRGGKFGGGTLSAGTSAATGLGLLTLAGVEFSQGVGNLALASGTAATGLGLLGSAGVQLFSPAFLLAVPTALGGVGSLAIAVVQLVQGVQHLSLVVPNVVAGIAALQTAGAQFAQGVNHTMLAAQLGAPGIAVLQTAGGHFAQGIGHLTTAGNAAVTVLIS